MKVQKNDLFGFRPINLTIILESEEEAKVMFCMFNWYPMTSFLDAHCPNASKKIRDALRGVRYDDLWDEMIISINKNK